MRALLDFGFMGFSKKSGSGWTGGWAIPLSLLWLLEHTCNAKMWLSKLSISEIFWFCMYCCSFRASPTPSKRSLSCKSPVKTQKKLLSKTDSAVELVNNAQFYLLFCATYWDWVEYFYQPICQSNPGPRIPPGACQPISSLLRACKNAYFATSFESVGVMAFSSE